MCARAHDAVSTRRSPAISALPGPEQTKTTTMLGEDGGRLHDMERRPPATPSVHKPHPERTIKCRQAKAWTVGATGDDQLVPQRDDLRWSAAGERTRNRSE
jgi:hypothetical protein